MNLNFEMQNKKQTTTGVCNLKTLSKDVLVSRLEKLISLEKRTTAEILDYIKEIDRRRIYLDLGFTSLFSYLTKGLGYTGASAQRRIDAARIMQALPEIKEQIQSGSLNLMQVSMVAQNLRQKRQESPEVTINNEDKRELLDKVKGLDIKATQQVISRSLNLEIKDFDKERIQQDESVRIEFTLSKEELKTLTRVKELISHADPNPSWAELVGYLANEYLKRKDPLLQKVRPTRNPCNIKIESSDQGENAKSLDTAAAMAVDQKSIASVAVGSSATSRMEVVACQKGETKTQLGRKYLPVKVKRAVFQKYQSCQWVNKETGEICGSRFQTQIDHQIPLWAGGSDDENNLHLLCGAHNRLKYQQQALLKRV